MYLISQRASKQQFSKMNDAGNIAASGSSSFYPTTAFLEKWKKLGLKSVTLKTLTETRDIHVERVFFRCLEKKNLL